MKGVSRAPNHVRVAAGRAAAASRRRRYGAPENRIAVFGAMPLARRSILSSLFAAYLCVFAMQQVFAQSDPLASWNAPTSAAIIDFVTRVTT
ncbi:hypothetical protein [Rhizobium leguminosarum]|uniref:hypothetical protein n=1 Tax=Rhizobium leguminosarum TaxID=384 RepID=UPI00143FAC86|nr:hypothetical protein [Rhizobium leguminosarum]MCA2406430.1 hypothetical protein [Rhizobium leguminosarum]NKM59895.1 hypothetical protein [Rhizobium leguminosarum bv. viciae]